MYALAVSGSPRKGGNTEILLKAVLSQLETRDWETELVKVGGTEIRGCIACSKCFESRDNSCSIKGDGFNEVFEKMIRADAIILGSPTYFAAISADLKALLERAGLVAVANDKSLAGKIGAGVVAVRRGGATHAFDTINHMFQMSQMIIPGSTYWNMGYGLAAGEVASDDEGMANMHHLGKVIDWLGRSINNFKEAYPRG